MGDEPEVSHESSLAELCQATSHSETTPAKSSALEALMARVLARTPARLFKGRAGAAYLTQTWLDLRQDHAAAKDAIHAELEFSTDFSATFVAEWALFEIRTLAETKTDFLRYPEQGRCLCHRARAEVAHRCPVGPALQVAIADGLSAAAVRVQVPTLLPLLAAEAHCRGWSFGQPFFIRHGRVGVLNDIGEILQPTVAVLLIGERPGLATAESLSAYMAFRPCCGHDDSHRNLISNIHAHGTSALQAVRRIICLAAQMMELQTSGVSVKESTPFAERSLAQE